MNPIPNQDQLLQRSINIQNPIPIQARVHFQPQPQAFNLPPIPSTLSQHIPNIHTSSTNASSNHLNSKSQTPQSLINFTIICK